MCYRRHRPAKAGHISHTVSALRWKKIKSAAVMRYCYGLPSIGLTFVVLDFRY